MKKKIIISLEENIECIQRMKQETDNYKISLKEKIVNKIINAGNKIMNTYVYHAPSGYIMIDTGYEHSLPALEI